MLRFWFCTKLFRQVYEAAFESDNLRVDICPGNILPGYIFIYIKSLDYIHSTLGGGGAIIIPLKSAASTMLLHTKHQKIFQGTLGTQDYTSVGSKASLGPSMDPTGTLNWTLWFLRQIPGFLRKFRNFYFWYSLALLTMLEHLFSHCPTLLRLTGPFWTSKKQ